MISPPPKSAAFRRVSLTPLIDVVFILLVFFMLETTFREEGGLQMLGAQGGSSGSNSTSMLVEAFDVETIWIDGERYSYDAWLNTGQPITGSAELRTAPGISLQHVVNLTDTLKNRGAEKVRLGKVTGFGAPW